MRNSIGYSDVNEDSAQKLADVLRDVNNLRKENVRNQSFDEDVEFENFYQYEMSKMKRQLRFRKMIAIDLIVMVSISFCVFANYIFAYAGDVTSISADTEIETIASVEFEANENSIDIENVLLDNVSVIKTRELVEEPKEIEFDVKTIEDENLPMGEEVVDQEGVLGSKDVTEIKTYENEEMVDENIIEEVVTKKPTEEIVRVGTSQFLKDKQVHIGDTIYVVEGLDLKEKANTSSNSLGNIPASLEVSLVEMNGDWCKVKYNNQEGFISSSKLTSSAATPDIVEKNRIQKLKLSYSDDMALNKSSGLTLNDFKKILSNNSRDRNGVFTNAAEDFYKADINYNVNGVFLASIGIHESAWGTSTIANNKKNLFGYGAYDASPYESAYTFATYYEGIEILAKSLTKNYLNTAGTVLKDGTIATGVYFNGNNAAGVNVRYASDKEWHTKVCKYMSQLYGNL